MNWQKSNYTDTIFKISKPISNVFWMLTILLSPICLFGQNDDDPIIHELLKKLNRLNVEEQKDDSTRYYAIKLKEYARLKGDSKNLARGYYFHGSSFNRLDPEQTIVQLDSCTVTMQNWTEGRLSFELVVNNAYANAMSNLGRLEESVVYFQKSIDLIKSSETPEKYEKPLAVLNYNAALALLKFGKLIQAIEYLKEVNDYAIVKNDSIMMVVGLTQLGNIELLKENYLKAMEFFEDGLKYTSDKNFHGYSFLTQGIGQVYAEQGAYDKAKEKLNESNAIFRRTQNNVSLYVNMVILSKVSLSSGDIKVAEEYAKEALSIANLIKNDNFKIGAETLLCKCEFEKGNYLAATKFITKISNSLNGTEELEILERFHECAYKTEKAKSDFRMALFHKTELEVVKDSLLDIKGIQVAESLNAKYLNYKKEQEILRLEEDAQLKQISYRQKLLGLGGGALLLLSFIVVGYLNVNRKRLLLQNQKIEIEQRLLRSQLNPHFIFNALTSIQNYFFEKNSVDTALIYMSQLTTLMRQILENSRHEYIGLDEEISMLKNYLNIQKLRYKNRFEFKLEIDEQINPSDLMVPPLIAQPFVENAIEHGMVYRKDDGFIHIKFSLLKNTLNLHIVDNGIGLDVKKIDHHKAADKKKSLSTKIIKERLELISKLQKEKFDLLVRPNTKGGTEVILNLPIISN